MQVHTDAVDNSMKPRTSGAIALMSTGNLGGSWYYMLLGNLKIVNRTKATALPMTDQIIAYLNELASNRKSKTVIDPYSLDTEDTTEIDDRLDIRLPNMIVPNTAEHDSEHVEYDLETETSTEDDILVRNDPVVYDDIPVDTNTLLEDIFGVDTDTEEDIEPEMLATADSNIENMTDATEIVAQSPITPVELRRSPRLHEQGKYNRKTVGVASKYTPDISKGKYVLKMTVSQGISQLGDIAVQSVAKEMQQMCEKSVWEGVSMNSLTDTQKNNIISSSMFLKDKYHADGKFDKLKSRLVAGGHLQDRNVYDNGSSPTASTTSVFIIAAIAAKENRSVVTVDFPGAFLNSDMPSDGDHEVLMRLNKYLSNILINIDPSYSQFINKNGTIVVRLKKALYGCVESGKLWYDKISNDICNMGFVKNAHDICVFNRIEPNGSDIMRDSC